MNRIIKLLTSLFVLVMVFFSFIFIIEYISYRLYTKDKDSNLFSLNILYTKACTINSDDKRGLETLSKQIEYCTKVGGERAGYYLYNFGVKKSVYIDPKLFNELDFLIFPRDILREIKTSALQFFPIGSGINNTPINCNLSESSYECNVNDSGEVENHVIKFKSEFFIPNGFFQGSDGSKLFNYIFERNNLLTCIMKEWSKGMFFDCSENYLNR